MTQRGIKGDTRSNDITSQTRAHWEEEKDHTSEGLWVADHASLEDDFAGHGGLRSKAGALKDGAIFQHKLGRFLGFESSHAAD